MVKIKPPTLSKEKELWANGIALIGGIDEAGRGSWAGPVVTAVVVLPQNHRRISGVADSKLIKPADRDRLYEIVTKRALDFGVGIVDHDIIDKIGILEATKLAAKQAIEMLNVKVDFLLTDALDLKKYTDLPHSSYIKGDQNIYSISCASIVAKVTRDNIMKSLGGDYKKYEFYKHKGYGTKRHQELLAEYGPCDIHRKYYAPIKELYEQEIR